MPKVLLLGVGPTALSALESLASGFDVVGVVRDAEAGNNSPDPVVIRAQVLGIPIYTQVAPGEVQRLALKLKPDCVVVSSFHRILRPQFFEQFSCVNVHYAPLPRYRGRANVNWAVINDEPFSAITIHMISASLDAGNILFQQFVPIQDNTTVTDLYEALNAIQREVLAATVQRMLEGYAGEPQSQADATYGCSRNPEDGEIAWRTSTRQIHCLIRGLTAPFPGAYTFYQGRRLTIWGAEPLNDPPNYVGRIPGRVIAVSHENGHCDVLTGDSVLRIKEVQLEGEGRTLAANVITSVRATLGLSTRDLLDRIRALEQQIVAVGGNAAVSGS
jgi:methionyl-tRNA formyltransferase